MTTDTEQFRILCKEITARYEPLSVIGYGAFALIFEARDRRTGQIVAIKHFHTRDGNRSEYFRELKLITRLKHPQVVKCLDICTADEESSDLVFEFADKGSLRNLLWTKKTLDMKRVYDIMSQIGAGLEYAHHQGLVHRDLKPENVLIFSGDSGDLYKLADFGVATFIGLQRKAITSIGSPAYMAPEQFYDEYDYKSDIYGLGIMFYELVHGDLPYTGSPAELFRLHNEAELEIRSDVPGELAQLILWMTQKEPSSRPTANEVTSELKYLCLKNGYDPITESPTTAKSAPTTSELQTSNANNFFGSMFADLSHTEAENQEGSSSQPKRTTIDSAPDNSMASSSESTVFGDFSDTPRSGFKHPTPKSIFSEGFDEADKTELTIIDKLNLLSRHESNPFGKLNYEKRWSRAVDSQSIRIVNIDDDKELLVITRKGIQGLDAKGGRGGLLFEGAVEVIGTSSKGVLPFVSDNHLLVLRDRIVAPDQWLLETDVEQLAISPTLSSVVTSQGHSVNCHNIEGEHQWTAEFNADEGELFISFDQHGTLMVLNLNSEDQSVRFFDPNGNQIGSQWLPGRILSATRCRQDPGVWVIVKRKSGFEILNVAQEGVLTASSIDHPLYSLVGAQDWTAGIDPDGKLWILDPKTGAMTHLELQGEVADYEKGVEDNQLYVLERRKEILHYVSAWTIQPAQHA